MAPLTYHSDFSLYGKTKKYILFIKEKYYKEKLKVGERGRSNGRSANKVLAEYVNLCKIKGIDPLLRLPSEVSLPKGGGLSFTAFLTGDAAKLVIDAQKRKRERKLKLNKNKMLHHFITDFIALSEEHKKESLKKNAIDVELLNL